MARIGTEHFPPARIYIYLILNIALFYCWLFSLRKTEHLTTKQNIVRSRIISFFGILLLYTGVCLVTADLIAWFNRIPPMEKKPSYYAQICWRGLYFFTLASAAYLAEYTIRLIKKNSESEIRELKTQYENQQLAYELSLAQNAYLQGQIDRHMMSNALHFAYEKVVRISDTGAKAISLVSEIVDYGISLPQRDSVISIDREIEQVNNLISLNKLRFGERLHLIFDNHLSGHMLEIKVLPYLLTTITENVFQHGDFQDAENPAFIEIKSNGQNLWITSRNKKSKSIFRQGHGIALQNITTRLNALYKKDTFSLRIVDDSEYFRCEFWLAL